MKCVEHFAFERKIFGSAVVLEDSHELVRCRTAQQHLVLDAPQECLVAQVLGAQVRRKHQERFKRHRHLAARHEAQIVHAPLHRHNPAVQHFGRSGQLPAEIVNQVDSVVGLQLEGRFVDLRRFVIAQVEHVQRQLAAADDERPPALRPSPVKRGLLRDRHHRKLLVILDRLVIDRIEHAHDVALAFDGMRHENRPAIQIVERFDQVGLAVPGLAVDQHGISAADGRTDLRKHVLGDHHPAQRLRQRALGQPSLLGTLPLHLLDVLRKRHRRRTRVLAGFEHFPGQCPARIRQPENRAHASHAERPLDLYVVLQLQRSPPGPGSR